MKVFLLQDIPGVGVKNEIITTKEGYARNFLIPKKLAIEVTKQNEELLKNKVKTLQDRKKVIATKTSILAEKIESTSITIKRKMHNEGKLYGSISESEIVDELEKNGINISKNQVIINKSIKSKGNYEITIKLTSTLKPILKVKVVSE
jgi:large subunit ribosomal protein L9